MNNKLLITLFVFSFYLSLAQTNSTVVTATNTGQAFTCIAVDTSHNVWAGTNKKGLFHRNNKYNPSGTTFSVVSNPGSDWANFVIQSIAADNLSNVWIGHAGTGSGTAAGGGLELYNSYSASHVKHYGADRNEQCTQFFAREGLATRNVQSIAVDEYNTVWTAHRYHDLTGTDYILTPGSLSYKYVNKENFVSKSTWMDLRDGNESPELPYPAYTCQVPIQNSPGSRTCNAVACGKLEVWLSVFPYEYAVTRNLLHKTLTADYLPPRILVYDLNGIFKEQISFETIGITGAGVFNAICITKNQNRNSTITKNEQVWVGTSAAKGFAVRIDGCWTFLDASKLPGIFLDGANVNNNAIWANRGQVFIGTDKGLIVYNGVGKIDDPTSYQLYTTANTQLPSNNITGGANDRDTVQWVATDNGIARISSKVNFSISDDYTSCGDAHINAIEKQLKTDLYDRPDFHSYVVETEICTKSGPNDTKCSAQEVFRLMESNIAFQAPSPRIFTHDNLKLSMLALINDKEKNQIVANVNAWKEDKTNGNEYGGIKDIRQVLTTAMIAKYYCPASIVNPFACFGDGQIPFFKLNVNLSQEEYEQKQAAANAGLTAIVSCNANYTLYNSPNHIRDRKLFSPLDKLFCGGRLTSVEYDQVKLFVDKQNLTITNYTNEGHFLDPGKVKRFVVEDCGKVKVVTIGTGLNYCGASSQAPDELTESEKAQWNELYGDKYPIAGNKLSETEKAIFKKMAMQFAVQNGNGNLILGSIMFKNIDMLLKQGFDAHR